MSQTFYNYDKQQFNNDVSLNGATTISGAATFTAANTIMNGNVGIGTTNPLQKLCITGSGTDNTRLVFTDTSVASSRKSWGLGQYLGDFYGFSIGDNGNSSSSVNWLQVVRKPGSTTDISCVTFPNGKVGIGLTNPNAPLQFANVGANRTIVLYDDYNNDYQYYGFGINSSILRYNIDSTNSSHVFYAGTNSTTANELMRIQGNGNVGIGTKNPEQPLHVVGNAKIVNDLYLGESNGGGRIYLGGGADGDNGYNHSVIETRKYSEFESTELLLFKGNDDGDDRIRLRAGMIQFDTFSAHTTDRTAESIRMTIAAGNGNVGIGTTNPAYKFAVYGTGNSYTGSSANDRYFKSGDNGLMNANTLTFDISIYGSGYIYSSGYVASSDTRIKNNIIDINDENALQTLRLIKPKTYGYVDKYKRGDGSVIGFIAQEIKEIIPKAVTFVTEFVPSFYTNCIVSTTDASNIVLVTSPIDLSWNPLHDQSGNAFVDANGNACSDASGNKVFKVKLYDQSNNEINCKTTSILDNRSFLMDVTGTKMVDANVNVVLESDGGYFLYGQEVDDFHSLDKNAIFTVVTAAVQDIDRKQVLDEAKIAALESKNAALEAQVDSLQTQVASLQSQMAAVLSKLSM